MDELSKILLYEKQALQSLEFELTDTISFFFSTSQNSIFPLAKLPNPQTSRMLPNAL